MGKFLFIVSAVSICALQLPTNQGKVITAISYVVSIPIVACIAVFFLKKYDIFQNLKNYPKNVKCFAGIYAVLTAFVFCVHLTCIISEKFPASLPRYLKLCAYLYPSILAVFSLFALFAMWAAFLNFALPRIGNFIRSLTKWEKSFIILSYAFFLPLLIADANGVDFSANCVLFSTDNIPKLYENDFDPFNEFAGNTFAYIGHAQNSERKFFSPIAMLPFSIPATFVSYFVKISSGYYLFPFLFKMFCGVGFISVSAILFSRFLPMGGIERFLFCLIYLFSFCSVLFIFIPEQYTLVVLCISILLTAITHKSAHLPEIFWVTVGTLITNGVLIFLIDSWKPFRERIYSLIRGAVFVLCVSLVFGQAHSFVKIVGHIESTSDKFSKPLCAESVFLFFETAGGTIVNPDNFETGGKIEPNTRAEKFFADTASLDRFNPVGVCMSVLALAGIIYARKLLISKICLLWIGLAVFILAICGYGVVEISPLLYSYYFMWAFLIPVVILANGILPRYLALPLMGAAALSIMFYNLSAFYGFYTEAAVLLG